MRQLGPRKRDLIGSSLSAQGPGLVLVDSEGRPLLETCPNWQDTRCLEQGERLIQQVGLGWASFGMPRNSFPAKLLWAVEHHPLAAQQARYALGIKDYLVHWLTGEFATEPSTTAGGDSWWTPVFDACGWPVDRLPRIVGSQEIVGQLLPERAAALGLPRSLPLVMGLNDGAAATLSLGALRPHDAVLTLATSGVIRLVLPERLAPPLRLDHDLFCWPYVAGRWIAGGQIKTGASALQWFEGMLAGEQERVGIEERLAEAATSPPGSRGVICLPYLLGRGSPQPDATATGAFLGLTLSTQRADLCRAVLEGVAFALRELADDFARLGHPFAQLRISGGGARSPLWRQIMADVLGCELTHHAADSTLGGAIIAAVGVGLYRDLATATQAMVHPGGITRPEGHHLRAYLAAYHRYQQWRDRLYPASG
jgi:sugar (pentulose or hexulose) kinase